MIRIFRIIHLETYMKNTTLCFLAASILFAAVLPADEVVIRRFDVPRAERVDLWADKAMAASQATMGSLTGVGDKLEVPTTFYILPFIKIDPGTPDGDLTLVSVRNEHSDVNTVTIDFFAPDSLMAPVATLSNALLSKEVWSLNLLAEGIPLPLGTDGFRRGWARINAADGPISADYFQIDPGNDFAAGSRPVDLDADEFCSQASARFLIGGGFSGGTKLFFMLDSPLGGDINTDPPSVTGDAFLEDSTFVGSFDIYTDNYTLEVDAADLVEPGTNFGSFDIFFENAFAGGYVHVEYKANNRFSVSVKGVCTDTLIN